MARENLLQVIALCLAAVSCAIGGAQAQASSRRLDCSGTYGSTSLSTIRKNCSAITDEIMLENAKDNMEPVIALEFIETCACALINHELAWASLMTHENEVLFLAIKEFINEWDKRSDELGGAKKEEKPNRDTNPMFQGEEGQRRYYWDRLDDILRSASDEIEVEEVSVALRTSFAKIYYEPGTFKARFASARMHQSQRVVTLVSNTCKSVLGKFADQFALYFHRLSRLSENDTLFFSLTAYNHDLYKLRLNTKACLFFR